jgi:hypothetical protein
MHLVPAPHSAAGILGEGRREALLLGDLVGALLAHAEEVSDLDQAERSTGVHDSLTLRGLCVLRLSSQRG